jgi:hypothetical protein
MQWSREDSNTILSRTRYMQISENPLKAKFGERPTGETPKVFLQSIQVTGWAVR